MTTAKVALTPTVAGAGVVTHSLIEGGIIGATNVDVVKNVRLLASGMWGPDSAVMPLAWARRLWLHRLQQRLAAPASPGATGGCDVHLSPVHAGDLLLGTEIQAGPKTQIGAYYGGAYFQRNAFPDLSAAGAVKPIIGFGGTPPTTPPTSHCRKVPLDFVQTFWKSPQYGSLLTILQGSYVTRAPWFVPCPSTQERSPGSGLHQLALRSALTFNLFSTKSAGFVRRFFCPEWRSAATKRLGHEA